MCVCAQTPNVSDASHASQEYMHDIMLCVFRVCACVCVCVGCFVCVCVERYLPHHSHCSCTPIVGRQHRANPSAARWETVHKHLLFLAPK